MYDRLEVNDILRSLQEDGFVGMRCAASIAQDEDWRLGALDEEEEKGIFWFTRDEKHWYQV